MKQLVSIFRAEGKLAADLRRICINTAPVDMLTLRESLREQALSDPHPTAFIEFLDDWSMGDDFKRVLGAGTRTRYIPMGVVYIRSVTPLMRSSLQQQMKRRQQFPEQKFLTTTLTHLAAIEPSTKAPLAIALFRQILNSSTPRECF